MTAMKFRTWRNIPMRARDRIQHLQLLGHLDRGIFQELAQFAAARQGLRKVAHLLLRRSLASRRADSATSAKARAYLGAELAI